MKHVVLAGLIAGLLAGTPGPAAARPDPPGAPLSVMAWNLAMLPDAVVPAGQRSRAALIPLFTRGHDALILSEVFDDDVRERLLRRLAPEYPFATDVPETACFLRQDGGVLVASRWPIIRQAQLVYRHRTGNDLLADKGAVYACLDRGGQRVHVFGTHTQAGEPGDPARVAVRAQQLAELRAFVDAQGIPADEPVLVGGDLNIDRSLDPHGAPTGELARALQVLGCALPGRLTGLDATYDPTTNAMATDDERTFLDYVLWSRRHAAPCASTLEARRVRSPIPLRLGRGRVGRELSDHEPVVATFTFGASRGLAGALPGGR